MKTLLLLTKRNIKLYFKDKTMFLVSLITPMILIVLYLTFLGNVFKNGVLASIPQGVVIDDKALKGLIGGQIMASILATSCVTVAFCSNLLMVQDKYTGVIKDLTITPVKKPILALSYFWGSLFATLIVCYCAVIIGFILLAIAGWYLTVADVFLIILDVFILCLFGTSLSSILFLFLKTQGQVSAVSSLVSSLYGFISIAYMPLSQLPKGLQNFLTCLPGTYGTVLMRNHCMSGAINKLGVQKEIENNIRFSLDCNISFFGTDVKISTMYMILIFTTLALIGIYILLNFLKKSKSK